MSSSTSALSGPDAVAQRLAYHTGMLLDAADLRTEQDYHRGRLARALSGLHGHGTVAGLAVAVAEHDGTEHITIAPGLAIDRLGRLVELLETHCLRIERWIAQIAEGPNGRDELLDAFTPDGEGASVGTLTADVFIAFAECAQGLRPGLPQANVDAIDALVPGRQAESARCELVLRQEDDPPLPRSLATILGAPPADAADALALLAGHKLGEAWLHDRPGQGLDGGLPHDLEHVVGQHAGHELFLARLAIPLALPADGEPHRTAAPIVVDNDRRLFVYRTAELAWLAGLGR